MPINTYNEHGLHASLKLALAHPGATLETPRHGYIIDIIQPDGELVEIQTSGLGKLRRKLTHLSTAGERIRLVLPIAVRTTLHGPTPGVTRTSPKKGTLTDVFADLVHAPHVVALPGLRLTVALVEQTVHRAAPTPTTHRRRWRHRPLTTSRDLRRILDIVEFPDQTALTDRFLPATLSHPFTTADLATALTIHRRQAQQIAYVFRALGLITPINETQKRNIAYLRLPPPTKPLYPPD